MPKESTQQSTPQLLQALRERVDAKIRADLAAEERAAQALRQQVLAAVRGAVEEARSEEPCGRVWLFGSFAWGQPGERSDVDLLVEGDDGALARRVEQATGRDVHAMRLSEAPASLRDRVLAHGLPL
jgi:predicted nucleotidyltransferase